MNFYIKKITFLICVCLVVFETTNTFSQEKTLVLGGQKGWPNFSLADSIDFGKGRFGYKSIEIKKNARKIDVNTDLLINFEDADVSDKTFNYKITSNDLVCIKESVMGYYCGLSRGKGNGISLKGNPGTIFGTEGNIGSFAIEFWLNPYVAENGEIVFSWTSSRTVNNYILYQMIMASFGNSRLEWNFKNIFDGYNSNNGEVILKSYSIIIPNKWSHHVLIYNEESGLLEYKIDGRTEDLKYITSTNKERGTIFQPILGLPNSITLCQSFTGGIDDFRILHSLPTETFDSTVDSIQTISKINYDFHQVTGARFETQPIMTVPGAIAKKLETIDNIPPQTEIRYYIRSGENIFGWNEEFPKWTEIFPGKQIEQINGKYFQLAAQLYPDGAGKNTPSISEMKLTYFEPSLPLPPIYVKAIAGNGCVDLNWKFSLDDTVAGYYVYYGTRQGEYLGLDSSQGASPIDVGNVNNFRIEGLKNDAVYYFVIASYSKYDKRIIGNFSDEVFARPKKLR